MKVNVLKRGPSRGGGTLCMLLQVPMLKASTSYFENAQAKPVIITVFFEKLRTQWNSQCS